MTEVYPILNSDTKCVYNSNENDDMPSLEWETARDARLLKGLQLPWSLFLWLSLNPQMTVDSRTITLH